jgi:hypothetical protein
MGDEEFHQEPGHASTFMKMVKERTRTMSAVKKGTKYYLQKSSGVSLLTDLNYAETILKVIMDKLVLGIYLIQVSRRII